MQDHYNLIYREEEREMLPLCREEGMGVIPYSPLASGLVVVPSGAIADALGKVSGLTGQVTIDATNVYASSRESMPARNPVGSACAPSVG